ncbi:MULTISPECIES: XdhC family protein [Streptomyces]
MAERTPRLARYGISDDAALAVGVTCGGTTEVFIEPVDAQTYPELPGLLERLCAGTRVALATVLEHPRPEAVGAHLVVTADDDLGGTGSPADDARIRTEVRTLLRQGDSGLVRIPSVRDAGEIRLFVNSLVPSPRMLVFGANDFAAALAQQARLLGHRTTVCDARPVFTTSDRFPGADEVVVAG